MFGGMPVMGTLPKLDKMPGLGTRACAGAGVTQGGLQTGDRLGDMNRYDLKEYGRHQRVQCG